jgi:hypothetical protein
VTGKQFKKALKRHGFTPYAAAPYFDRTPRQMQNIVAGDSPVPGLWVRLLKAIEAGKLTWEDLIDVDIHD